jgi:superfamily II DNA/RNA helicase
MSFAELGVSPDLCALLEQRDISEPFPIQSATIADGLAGRDICGRAPTGSGKTLAFGLVIAARDRRARPRSPRALVLVPTRELAVQVQKELSSLVGHGARGAVAIYGGVGYGPQRQALNKGASIVVACPGRLEDLVAHNDVDLSDVDLVVVDEADRMADMGFLPSVRRLLDATSPTRQTLLFSATLDRDVDALVQRYQNDPARHEVGADPHDEGDVSHLFWRVERDERIAVTADLITRHGRSMVFCRTRHGADRVVRQLAAAGVQAEAIHGSRSQAQRERALGAFMAGRVQALVATDVAARGIHVDDVACVIHFDPPPDAKDYTHRSGRTGRAGASGIVVCLVSNDTVGAVRTIQKELGFDGSFGRPGEQPVMPRRPARREPPLVREEPVPAAPRERRPAPREVHPVAARDQRPAAPAKRDSRRPDGRRPQHRAGSAKMFGTVKFFHPGKGFGFLSRKGGDDVFVHFSGIDGAGFRNLVAGQSVEFELVPGRKGDEARNVKAV